MFRKMLVAVIAVLALSLSSRHAAACGRPGILIWACDGPSATSVGRVGYALGLSFSGASMGPEACMATLSGLTAFTPDVSAIAGW